MKGPAQVYAIDEDINKVASTTRNQVLHYQKHYYVYLWEWTSQPWSTLYFDFAALFYVNVFGHSRHSFKMAGYTNNTI